MFEKMLEFMSFFLEVKKSILKFMMSDKPKQKNLTKSWNFCQLYLTVFKTSCDDIILFSDFI